MQWGSPKDLWAGGSVLLFVVRCPLFVVRCPSFVPRLRLLKFVGDVEFDSACVPVLGGLRAPLGPPVVRCPFPLSVVRCPCPLCDRLPPHVSPPRPPRRRPVPGPARPLRDEVRARDDAGARRGDGPPRARLPLAADRRDERQGLGRGLLRRGAARLGPAHRPLHLAPPRPRPRADHRRRPRDQRPRLRARGACRARRRHAARAPRRARRAPDLLRGADRRRVRALPRRAGGRGGAGGGPRRTARRDERRGAARLGHRQRGLRPRGVPRPHARRDRAREGRRAARGAADGDRAARGRARGAWSGRRHARSGRA